MIIIPPSTVIAKYLLDLSLVKSTGTDWRYSVDNMPDEGDNYVTVYDTTPVTDGKVMQGGPGNKGETILHYGIQVAVRSKSHAVAWAKGIEIQNALDRGGGTLIVLNGLTYKMSSFMLTIPLTKIGNEEKNRRLLFAINGITTIREV